MATSEPSRDIDIWTATQVAGGFNPEVGDYFTLTGSYSIEALTQRSEVVHNDIDANVFTTDRARAMHGALGRIGLIYHDGFPDLVRRTDARLDYEWANKQKPRTLELQFIDTASIRDEGDDRTFVLGSHPDGREILVPTTMRNLPDNGGHEHPFRVKTLPYAIATWALRISGVALNQKRAVRDTDVAHFAFLLSADYTEADVLHAATHHPQMPEGYVADDVLSQALERVRR